MHVIALKVALGHLVYTMLSCYVITLHVLYYVMCSVMIYFVFALDYSLSLNIFVVLFKAFRFEKSLYK